MRDTSSPVLSSHSLWHSAKNSDCRFFIQPEKNDVHRAAVSYSRRYVQTASNLVDHHVLVRRNRWCGIGGLQRNLTRWECVQPVGVEQLIGLDFGIENVANIDQRSLVLPVKSVDAQQGIDAFQRQRGHRT